MRGIVNVMSGICGLITEIRATTDDPLKKVHLEINTRCENIQKLAEELKVVNLGGRIKSCKSHGRNQFPWRRTQNIAHGG